MSVEPSAVSAAVTNIKTILDHLTSSDLGDPTRKADYYADLAVKGSLQVGNTTLAREILLRGLQLEPQSRGLWYLARIMIHEGVLQASDLPIVTGNGPDLY